MDEDDIEDIAPSVSPQDAKLRFDLDQLKAALVRSYLWTRYDCTHDS